MNPRPTDSQITWRDHGIGFGFAVAYLVLLVVTAPRIGLNRDEGVYFLSADRYADWFTLVATDQDAAFERATIERHWSLNHEHPALMKSLFALSKLANDRYHLTDTPSQAYRFPAMVTGALLLWLVYIFGARTFGRQAAAFAAAALATMPQFFFHAHLACFDVPIAFFLTLVVYAYHRSLTAPLWSIPTGFAYGLALATKHNAWILPFVLLVHFGWMAVAERQRRKREGTAHLSLVPWWLFAMIIIGPFVFVSSWPWLYDDTTARFLEYARFHLGHEYYNMAYFGVNYYRPPFPITYPFVMTAFTVPMITLVLASFGLVARAGTYVPWPLGRFFDASMLGLRDVCRTDVLFVGCALAPLVAIAWPTTPIFGGTKHWLAAYPFLALYAGYAGRRVIRRARAISRAILPDFPRFARASVAGVLLLPSFVEMQHSHPFGLAHYTFLAGGTPGAATHGMNRQFWGYTTRSLVDYFARVMPDGGSVWICDTVPMAFEMLKRDGLLPTSIRIAATMEEADYAIVHHEHHFAEVEAQLWVAYSPAPAYVLTHDGVPIISVYENPRHRERRAAGPRR